MDYADLVKLNSSGVCLGCLNYNRKMLYSDKIKKCFNMVSDIDIPEGVVVKVCWECMAYIDNVFQFKDTVERSHRILLDYSMKNKDFYRLEQIKVFGYHRLKWWTYELVDIPPQQEQPVKANVKVEQDVDMDSDLSLDSAPFDNVIIKEAPTETASAGALGSTDPTLKEYEVPLVSANSLQKKSDGEPKIGKAKKPPKGFYKCSQCGRVFAFEHRLLQHMSVHAEKKIFICEICSYTTPVSGYLKMHMFTHTGEKPFSCDTCSYRCRSKGRLKQHMQVHTGNYSFSCKSCSYKCVDKTSMRRHMRTHTGERPFSCELCPYKSIIKGNLNKHMRTHTGEKPFVCEFCSSKFTCTDGLKKHLRTHTDEKPFSCEICSHRFRDKKSLKSHIETHTDVKLFGCELCSYRARRKYALKEHMRTHMNPKGVKKRSK